MRVAALVSTLSSSVINFAIQLWVKSACKFQFLGALE